MLQELSSESEIDWRTDQEQQSSSSGNEGEGRTVIDDDIPLIQLPRPENGSHWMGHNLNYKREGALRIATLCMDSNIAEGGADTTAAEIAELCNGKGIDILTLSETAIGYESTTAQRIQGYLDGQKYYTICHSRNSKKYERGQGVIMVIKKRA